MYPQFLVFLLSASLDGVDLEHCALYPEWLVMAFE